jgi:hypothetical protein
MSKNIEIELKQALDIPEIPDEIKPMNHILI